MNKRVIAAALVGPMGGLVFDMISEPYPPSPSL